jgi:hypothetical protein
MEQVSFKVSLNEKSQVRRFEVPQDCSTSYIYLKEKLKSVFGQELLGNSGFNITWQDHEGDIVTVETDEELLIALNELKGPVYKFNLVPSKAYTTKSNDPQQQERQPRAEQIHPGIICDGCQGKVSGFRYKCMTCPDYDLCEHCEAQRIHSGHKMMRISTPESIWPGFNINSLNKMQNRGSECSKESRKQGGACRYPRGTRCPPRGFGMGGMKREGCKVLPPPFCWMTNQQSCNNTGDSANSEESSFKRCKPDQSYGARSPMNDLLNIGEIVRATEESVRTALESANLNSKDSQDSDSKEKSKDSNEQSKDSNEHSDSGNPTNDLNNVGQVIKALLSSFGVDVEVGTKTDNSDESNKKSEQEEPMDSENSSESKNSEDKENSVDSNQTEEHQKTDSAEKPSATTGDEPETRSSPVLTENKSPYSALEKEVQEALEESVMPVSPKIKVALQAMENMGFNNDDGWLSDLLLKYDGDIGKVLDLINKRN